MLSDQKILKIQVFKEFQVKAGQPGTAFTYMATDTAIK